MSTTGMYGNYNGHDITDLWTDESQRFQEVLKQMSYYNPNTANKSISTNLEKWVVISNNGSLQGSWEKQKDAVDFCRRALRDRSNTQRYLLLESKKEIGTKSPEIEIEEIK